MNRFITPLAVLALLLAGCGGTEENDDATRFEDHRDQVLTAQAKLSTQAATTLASTPSPTLPPIRAAAPTVAPTPTLSPTPETIDAGILARALLTVEDLPPGWAGGPRPADASDEDDNFCGIYFDTDPQNLGVAVFTQALFGPYLTHTISLSNRATATRMFSDVRSAIHGCKSWADPTRPDEVWQGSELTAPRIAEESIGIRLTSDRLSLFGTGVVEILFYRQGGVVSSVGYMTFAEDSGAPSPRRNAAEVAYNKLAQAGIR